MESLVAPLINLSILLFLLVYKLRGPIREYVSQRHQTIQSDLISVKDQLAHAEAQFNEFSAKLKAVEAEVRSLRSQIRREGIEAKERILQESKGMATTVVADAKRAAEGFFDELKGQLYLDQVAQIFSRVEVILNDGVNKDDRLRIRQEFSDQMGRLQ